MNSRAFVTRVGSRHDPSRLLRSVWVVTCFALSSTACYHLVSPPFDASPNSDDEQDLPVKPETAILIVNGYSAETPQWFRSEGADQLGADLREWSEHLIGALSEKLTDSGALVYTRKTAAWLKFDPAATLVVKVTSVTPPRSRGGGGAAAAAELASGDVRWKKQIDSGDPDQGFVAAFARLREAILMDASFREWVLALPRP